MSSWQQASEAQNDFLAIEPHLVARLKEALAGASPAIHVLTAAELADVAEAKQFTPAVHVIYGRFEPLETRSDGAIAKLRHTWLIVTAVKSAADTRHGAAARADASALMAKAGAALMGFRPPNTAGPLLLTRAPQPLYRAGFQYLPLAFTVESLFVKSTT